MQRDGRRMRGVAAVATVVLAGVAAGCGSVHGESDSGGSSAPATKKTGSVRLAVVPKAVGFDFWEQVKTGAECAASKQKDVKVQWDGVTAETDVTGQVNLLQNFITQHVDGLVYAATDAKVLSQVTDQAIQAKIPVVNIDSGTEPQPKTVPLFATDNVTSAQKVPELMAKSIGSKGGEIAFIPFQRGTSTNEQRAQGFKEGLKQHPELKLVAEQSSQSDYDKALQVTEDILTAHPNLRGIFAANEPGALGAAEAVRRAGKSGKVVIVGWDASPDEIKGVQAGVVDALIVQNPFKMGYSAVNAAVKEIRDGTKPQGADTGVTIVTKRNLNDPKVQKVLKPSCANPPT
jgi:ribose transport system substrate-binding protein